MNDTLKSEKYGLKARERYLELFSDIPLGQKYYSLYRDIMMGKQEG